MDQRLQALSVFSANPEEGKTLVNSDLALSLAHMGKEVLLIDADLRKSSISTLFGISLPPQTGLPMLLAGKGGTAEMIVPSGFLEAMATGTVCVLNDIEPFRMILGEESRLLVDFSRTAEAADKIVELMNLTPDQYARLAESLKARAGMFSWDRTIQKLESAYRDSV